MMSDLDPASRMQVISPALDLFSLPVEVRRLIWEQFLDNIVLGLPEPHWRSHPRAATPGRMKNHPLVILFINRQSYNEAKSLVMTHVIFSLSGLYNLFNNVRTLLAHIATKIRAVHVATEQLDIHESSTAMRQSISEFVALSDRHPDLMIESLVLYSGFYAFSGTQERGSSNILKAFLAGDGVGPWRAFTFYMPYSASAYKKLLLLWQALTKGTNDVRTQVVSEQDSIALMAVQPKSQSAHPVTVTLDRVTIKELESRIGEDPGIIKLMQRSYDKFVAEDPNLDHRSVLVMTAKRASSKKY